VVNRATRVEGYVVGGFGRKKGNRDSGGGGQENKGVRGGAVVLRVSYNYRGCRKMFFVVISRATSFFGGVFWSRGV
jgi:hypothetical protein